MFGIGNKSEGTGARREPPPSRGAPLAAPPMDCACLCLLPAPFQWPGLSITLLFFSPVFHQPPPLPTHCTWLHFEYWAVCLPNVCGPASLRQRCAVASSGFPSPLPVALFPARCLLLWDCGSSAVTSQLAALLLGCRCNCQGSLPGAGRRANWSTPEGLWTVGPGQHSADIHLRVTSCWLCSQVLLGAFLSVPPRRCTTRIFVWSVARPAARAAGGRHRSEPASSETVCVCVCIARYLCVCAVKR